MMVGMTVSMPCPTVAAAERAPLVWSSVELAAEMVVQELAGESADEAAVEHTQDEEFE